jgi:hypothetical protein
MRSDWGSNAQRFVAQATASVVETNSQADSHSTALDSIAQAEDAYGASKIQVKPRCGCPSQMILALQSVQNRSLAGAGGTRSSKKATRHVHR